MKQIKYKYTHDDKKLELSWNNNRVLTILIEEDKDINIVELYDYIISNINEIEFINKTNEIDINESVHYKASEEIIKAFEEEIKVIVKQYNEFDINYKN